MVKKPLIDFFPQQYLTNKKRRCGDGEFYWISTGVITNKKYKNISNCGYHTMWISYNIHTSVITIGYNKNGNEHGWNQTSFLRERGFFWETERERVGPGPWPGSYMFQPTNMLTKRTNMTWVKWLENIDCWPLVRPQVGCLHTQTQTSSWQVMICSPIILLLCAPLLMIDGRNASVGIRFRFAASTPMPATEATYYQQDAKTGVADACASSSMFLKF